MVKYGSNHVTLLGDVKNPGLINFEQIPTLLEVLSKGGIETRPDGNLPEQCVIYRGEQVLWVDLQELLTSGSPLADLRLRRNDVIFVPAISTRSVTVMGQVMHPGQMVLKHNSTLTSVLGEAGGVSDLAGNNPELQDRAPCRTAIRLLSVHSFQRPAEAPPAAWKSRFIPAM